MNSVPPAPPPARSALLRSAAFVATYFVILFAAAVPKGMAPPPAADLTWGTLSSLGVLALTRWLLRREARTAPSFDLAIRWRSLVRVLYGAVIGCAVYAGTIVLMRLTVAPIDFVRGGTPSAAMWCFTVSGFLALSCMEELGFRGYPLHTLIPVLGHWPAQWLVATVFAVTHGLAGWPWETVFLGVLPSGLLFGVMTTRAGGLAMPIGLHAALNIAYWMVGAKETPGVWAIHVADADIARVAALAPYIGAALMLLASVLIAHWPRPASGWRFSRLSQP